jgi:hypothetical protein
MELATADTVSKVDQPIELSNLLMLIFQKLFLEKWRSIMRQSKSAELKKELQILSHTFERIMDRKDAVTQQLARDLEESEEQSRIATRAHQRHG